MWSLNVGAIRKGASAHKQYSEEHTYKSFYIICTTTYVTTV